LPVCHIAIAAVTTISLLDQPGTLHRHLLHQVMKKEVQSKSMAFMHLHLHLQYQSTKSTNQRARSLCHHRHLHQYRSATNTEDDTSIITTAAVLEVTNVEAEEEAALALGVAEEEVITMDVATVMAHAVEVLHHHFPST